ncbi:hypothetical protein HMPREF3202_01428 [Prevotella bivia]|uniref:Uncharacterized protein n=1 Tax=Prevotella bivia TaxID=28125 RepID=A0A137SUP0_9BACT|nr:hypothetical protein HMPREF3202_01428 [Prevotella bivia]
MWYQTQPKITQEINKSVVICLKISIFVVSNTTSRQVSQICLAL